ncbi:MAG: segregation/condensation protein A [Candidatus Aenigmarchaeota archaeon]|nr:segregation/condensation protein A [Candidatus Aenigmarchaeota archaeon]
MGIDEKIEEFQQISEEELLKKIIEKQSWEDIIYYIVSIENLDPWNLDLVKLADSFIAFIKKVKDLDFRIPAKVVFIAVILLKLKVETLLRKEEEKVEQAMKEEKRIEIPDIDLDSIKLAPPLKRLPKTQVTVEDLIHALKKVVEFRERKYRREFFARRRVEKNIGVEDVEKRIEKVLYKIEEKIKEGREKINFKELVEEWNREKIIFYFTPLLHLEMKRKIETEQEEPFKDLYIKKKEAN